MSARKKPEEPTEEGAPAWMNTYGDMITLILTFFILLFSFSTVDARKWEEVVNSLSGTSIVAVPALDPNRLRETEKEIEGKFVITATEPKPTPTVDNQSSGENSVVSLNNDHIVVSFNEMYVRIKNHIEENNLENVLNVQYVDEYTVLLRMSDSAFFDSGSAQIREDVKLVLQDVCGIIQEYQYLIKMIRVEGHTDNVPIRNASFRDNWDLSVTRASNIVRYIQGTTALDPTLLSATGYGEYHPIDTNETEAGKAKNRRVDFIIENILKG